MGYTVQEPEADILSSLNTWPKPSCLITHIVDISNFKHYNGYIIASFAYAHSMKSIKS